MLGFVAWLNLLLRNHDDLGLACLAQTVNVVSLIYVSMIYGMMDLAELCIDISSYDYS